MRLRRPHASRDVLAGQRFAFAARDALRLTATRHEPTKARPGACEEPAWMEWLTVMSVGAGRGGGFAVNQAEGHGPRPRCCVEHGGGIPRSRGPSNGSPRRPCTGPLDSFARDRGISPKPANHVKRRERTSSVFSPPRDRRGWDTLPGACGRASMTGQRKRGAVEMPRAHEEPMAGQNALMALGLEPPRGSGSGPKARNLGTGHPARAGHWPRRATQLWVIPRSGRSDEAAPSVAD